MYKQKQRFSGATVTTKACRACGKKGHMLAACTVPKEKLYCKFCDTKNSHNTSACIKKQKEDKDKKKGSNMGKTDKEVKPDTSYERREASERRKRDISNMRKNNGSPVTQHNSCVQVQTMGNFLSGTHSDSDEDSYKTPPETESEPEYDEDPNAPELSDDDLENDEEV